MPTYAYACPTCGPFDALRSIAQRDAPVDCPRCGSDAPRMVSAARLARGGEGQGGSAEAGSYGRLRHAAGCACC